MGVGGRFDAREREYRLERRELSTRLAAAAGVKFAKVVERGLPFLSKLVGEVGVEIGLFKLLSLAGEEDCRLNIFQDVGCR